MATAILSIRLPVETLKKLDLLANRPDFKDRSAVAKKAIADFLVSFELKAKTPTA